LATAQLFLPLRQYNRTAEQVMQRTGREERRPFRRS
jgi:hypothetical protein